MSMTEQEWLDSLKPGDEVAYSYGSWGHSWRIEKVTRRTPAGWIIVGTNTFGKNGRLRGEGYSTLKRVTDKLRSELDITYRTNMALYQIKSTLWRDVPLDTLESVVEILDRAKKSFENTNEGAT